ncbi:MAG: M23 family metallopeptidase [Leptospiraceae bacterium]|nr:M23 family metallopeptidase [Leptospiraceae bacterium]
MRWWHQLRYSLTHPGNWLRKRQKRLWSGVSILVVRSNSSAQPLRLRVNLILITFLLGLILTLPVLNLVIAVREALNHSNGANRLEKRVLMVYHSRLNLHAKEKRLATVQKQLQEYKAISYDSNPGALIRLIGRGEGDFFASDEEGTPESPNRNRYDIELLEHLHQRARLLFTMAARHSLHLLWHRISLHHLMPHGRPLPAGAGMITSSFGRRVNPTDKTESMEFHTGVDFGDAPGTPLIATAPGLVFKAVEDPATGYGNHVRLHHGFGYTTLYAHCQSLNVKQDEFVQRGDVVGFLGKTGRVTGHHLHYEVQFGNEQSVDPMDYVQLK